MRLAAAQTICEPGAVETNLAKIASFAERARAAGAELVVFPEMSDTGYVMPVIREKAQSWSEGAVPFLQATAQRLALGIICGVSERVGTEIFNAQVFIDAAGQIIGSYRKTHLFSAGSLDERECFAPGGSFCSYGFGGFRFGLTICYDLRFPEIFRALATEEEANVFVVSSAWPFPRSEHQRILAQARAIENQSYLLLANRVGTDEGAAFCGGSAIIDPAGTIVAAASAEREELVVAEVEEARLTNIRSRMSVFAHRRADLYRR